MIAPPPEEYAEFTQQRAVWQALGKRPDEMTAREFFRVSYFLQAEGERQSKRQG